MTSVQTLSCSRDHASLRDRPAFDRRRVRAMSGILGHMPEGRRGQAVALAMLAVVLGVLWTAVAAPLLSWHTERTEQVAQRRLMLAHMEQIVRTLPALRQEAGRAGSNVPPATALLGGATDAIAGATLQSTVQDMTAAAGATLTSSEALPGEQQGNFRRIGLRVAVRGDWPELIALLRAVDESPLRLLVANLQLHATAQQQQIGPAPIEASFVVQGFRPGTESKPTGAPG
jgi:general secretion pathway protein M